MSGKQVSEQLGHPCCWWRHNLAPRDCYNPRWPPTALSQILAAAGRAAVISKTCGQIILQIVGRGQVAAPAEDGHVAVVVVEACYLKLPASTGFAFRRNFFVQTALQNGTTLPPKQRWKRIQFIERRPERTGRLCGNA